MAIVISEVRNILARKFSGTNIDDVQGISNYSIFEEAASNLLTEIDPIETVRHSEIDLFDGVYDYSPPSDLKGKKIIDIRRQVRRADDFYQTFTEEFDRDKTTESFSVEFDEGSKLLRIANPVGNSNALTDVDEDNYTAGTGVSNIDEDTILFADNDGKSIRFDVSSGSNLLTWAGTAVDLSAHTLKSTFFLWVYYPDSSIVTSLKIRPGSSATAYYEITGSVQFGSLRNGWNLYKFAWNGATETSSVDEAAMDYARLELTTTAADTDIRIGRLYSKLPSPYEIVYYSNALFKPASGSTWLTKPTDETDSVLLEKEHQNLFIRECCSLVSEDLGRDEDLKNHKDFLYGNGREAGAYSRYKTDKPSETIRPQTRYYSIRKNRL